MKKLLMFLFALASFSLAAQNTSTDTTQGKYFIQLTNGKTIYTNDLKSDRSFFKGSYLTADNQNKYDLDTVKSYLSSDGLFEKFPINDSKEKPSWYRKEEKNRINVYSKQNLVNNNYVPFLYNDPAQMLAASFLYSPWYQIEKTYYFQVGNKSPKKFSYDNLRSVVGSNPQSIAALDKGSNLAVIRTLLVVTGLGLIINGGISSYCNNDIPGECAKKEGKGITSVVSGLVLCAVPLFITKPSKKYREAVYIFNK
jgi:hypothetical protein